MIKLNTYAPSEAFSEMENGLIVPSDYAPKVMPKAMDLFAGAGGFSCGFHKAGWHVVAASEWEPWATVTYLVNLGSIKTLMHFCSDEDHGRWDAFCKKNKRTNDDFGTGWISSKSDHVWEGCGGFGKKPFKDPEKRQWFHETYCEELPHHLPCEHFFFGDVRQLKCEDVLKALEMEPGELDCIMGGPPCQGFSLAGKRQVMDPRNSLVFEFCRMIVGISPKTMVMENVPGIVNMVTPEGVNVVDAMCLYLSKGGYSTFDALKRSLAGMPNTRAAVRRPGKDQQETEPPNPTKQKGKVIEQMEMAV